MDLCSKSAVELCSLVRQRQVSAVELLQAHLKQIEHVNPLVNAIVTLVPDHAFRLAEQIDKRIARGNDPGLLAGLPVAHKDLVETRGIRTTYGSRIFADNIPDKNALIVERIVQAGGVTLGKTNTPEWGAGSQTFNEVFGKTRNPYDISKTCGGSSGGAAVALASRMLPIADGGDLGGSLRNPAGFCNVVGFRTSAGRVPYTQTNGWFSLPVIGPMARTVQDCALFLTAIARPATSVPLSLPFQDFTSDLQRDFSNVKIAVSKDFDGQLPVDPAVQKVITNSMVAMRTVGCDVHEACPDFSGADEVFKTLRAWSMANTHRENISKHRDLYKDTIIWNVEQGMNLTGADVFRAEQQRTILFQRLQSFLQEYEFLILPVSQVPPFDIDLEYVTRIGNVDMETYIDWMKSCYYISVTGLPAISVPGGFTEAGLPVGIQIVGRHQEDLAVLQLAQAFESETGYWRIPPKWGPVDKMGSE